MVHGLATPDWVHEPHRFLNSWWFPADNPGYEAVAVLESPPAFRRRAIFIPASMLQRV